MGPAPGARPVFPAAAPRPVRPAGPARAWRAVPVLLAGTESCPRCFLLQPPGLLVHPMGALRARLRAAGSPSLLLGVLPGLPDLLAHFVADPLSLLARVILGLPDLVAPVFGGLPGLFAGLPGLVED